MKANFDKGTKVCSGCKVELPIANFNKDKYSTDGLTCQCSQCRVKVAESSRRRAGIKPVDRNRAKVEKGTKICSNSDCFSAGTDQPLVNFSMSKDNIDGLSNQCRICTKKRDKMRNSSNREAVSVRNKKWRTLHPEYGNNYRKTRSQIDPMFKLAANLRGRVNEALKQNSMTKRSSLNQYLGCTLPELKAHIEDMFIEGMTWDNHSHKGWHLDHILPLSPVVPISEDELLKRCHYTNLQPLWAQDNWAKRNSEIC